MADFARIDAVVDLDVADENLVQRLSGRRVCLNCGATYHVSTMKSDCCNHCGQALVQRDDDKPETVLSRLKVYHEQTAPLVSYYQDKNLLHVIDGAQQKEVIFDAILNTLGVKQ